MGRGAERLSQPNGETTNLPGGQQPGMKRRRLLELGLKGAVVLAGATKAGEIVLDLAKMVDVASGERNWPQTANRLLRLDECNEWFSLDDPQVHPQEAFITIGGLGCVSSWPHAHPMGIRALRLQEQATIPMSYLVTSNQGKTPEDVATIIGEEVTKSEALSFYGHSNGGPTVLAGLHALKEQGTTVPVKRLILNCSPFDFDDAKENFFAKGLARIANMADYEGGMYSKFIFQLWERLQAKGGPFMARLIQSIRESWHEASDGESPTPWLSDLYNLCDVKLDEYDFRGILTPETEILYLKSEHDDVVYNDQAIEKYKALARKYGAKFTIEPMAADVPHADSQRGSEYAEQWIKQTNRPSTPT